MADAQPSNLLRLSIPCDLVAVRGAALEARNFLAEQGIGEENFLACELALVEACNNAILYTHHLSRALAIEVQVFCHPEAFELHIVDHTKGFDWPETVELPAPDAEHGRGLF